MSDSKDSTVTYTEVSSPFANLSDIRSPGVDGPPVMLEDPYAYVVAVFQAPPSLDYGHGPEEPEQAPPSLVYASYVPEPAYPEFMPTKDEVLPAEEQPLHDARSPTVDSPGYVPESDPEKDPEEDDDEDPEEDPDDYPTNGGDDGDDEDESSDDDEDDDETKPFETDKSAATPPPHPAYRDTARISIRDEPPTPFWSDTEVARLLDIHTPPPSPLSPCPTYPLGCKAAMIRLRAEAPSTSHSPPPHIILSHTRADTPPSRTPPLLPIPLLTSSPSLLLPPTDHEADRPELCLPPQKRIMVLLPPWIGRLGMIYREMSVMGSSSLGMRCWQDTDEIYVTLDDEQTERQLMAGRLNMLYKDRHTHARTALLMEREARMSREAWG
ncbi:hypothetical protein Tco_1301180 [Tanacetum coccineum]